MHIPAAIKTDPKRTAAIQAGSINLDIFAVLKVQHTAGAVALLPGVTNHQV